MNVQIVISPQQYLTIEAYRAQLEAATGEDVSFGQAVRDLARAGAATKGIELPPDNKTGRPKTRLTTKQTPEQERATA